MGEAVAAIRVLRRGGVFLFSTPNISALRSRWRWLLIGSKSFSESRYLLQRNGFLISAVTTNRVKPVSWLYLAIWPLAWLATTLVFRRWERDAAQRRHNREDPRTTAKPRSGLWGGPHRGGGEAVVV